MTTIKLLKTMEKKTLLFYFLLIIGFLILVYLIISSKILENLEIFRDINLSLLLIAFLLTNLNILTKIFRWKYLSNAYGVNLQYGEAYRIVLGSFFVSGITPGKIGEILKAYIMKKRHGLPLKDGVACILYERVFELLLLFFVTLGVFYIGMSAKNYIIIQLTSFILIFILIAYIFSDKILIWAHKFLTRTKFLKIEGDNLRIKKINPDQALNVFILTGIALCLEFLRLWVVTLAFGFHINIIHLSIYFSLAVLIGLLSQIPIGIGVVEGSLALFLTDAGLPPYYAFGIVLVDRIISIYFVMAIGLIYYKWALTSAMEESK
jgi:glycosyltransferase 2 family protein